MTEKLSDEGLVSELDHPMKKALEEDAERMSEAGIVSGETLAMLLRVGKQRKYKFGNGYGASVVNGEPFTMSKDMGVYELAVTSHDGHLIYDTPVTSDVERGRADRMNELLAQIAALPPRAQTRAEGIDKLSFD